MLLPLAVGLLAAGWAGSGSLSIACGGGGKPPTGPGETMSQQDMMMSKSMDMPADDGSAYGPLEVGADHASYVKMNTEPVTSETHGGRLVDTYVNGVGARAYLDLAARLIGLLRDEKAAQIVRRRAAA